MLKNQLMRERDRMKGRGGLGRDSKGGKEWWRAALQGSARAEEERGREGKVRTLSGKLHAYRNGFISMDHTCLQTICHAIART
jgi:hypothetical protein